MRSSFTIRLLEWYAQHARQMPWRDHKDAYVIWVSEIMLQQTQVDTVTPYFERWLTRFPDIESVAAATQQEVLSEWEGLGYYSRARNLHRAAQILVAENDGQLPENTKALRQLPGIGRYTAAAIASMAFGKDEAALDGNIRRVLARVFDVRLPARSTEGERKLWELANENLPPGRAGDYNQALMDLGATICTPRQPDCQNCPLKASCGAYELGVQEQRPVKGPKPSLPHHTVTAAVIQDNGSVLIAQRPQDGLLGGLWEFPGGKLKAGEELPAGLRREIQEELGVEITVGNSLGVYRHAYTHFRVTLHAFQCSLVRGKPRAIEHSQIKWIRLQDLPDFPMGKLDRQIANTLTR
ncbi:MAG TPA: A/G-specific adenine glycosylase [Anaerolineales bacterium]